MSNHLSKDADEPVTPSRAEQLSLLESSLSPSGSPAKKESEFKPQNLVGIRGKSARPIREIKEIIMAKNSAAQEPKTLAPMLRQYLQMKKEYPEHLLLFQVGDFYEIFFEDAKIASAHLGIRLTSRDKDSTDPVPMCGVPVHAVDNYLPKLLKGGFSCVMMSQVEDAKEKKGMVRREITRIITPGVRFEGDGLDEKQFNYLTAVGIAPGEVGAVSYIDVSTGHLHLQEVESAEELLEVLRRVRPAEMILPSMIYDVALERSQAWLREARRFAQEIACRVVFRPFEKISKSNLSDLIISRLPAKNNPTGDCSSASLLEPLGKLSQTVLAAVLAYVDEVSFGAPPTLSQFSVDQQHNAVFIDAATRRNLELTETRMEGDRKNSLLSHIDYTCTPMGARLLADWLLAPSPNLSEIESRHESVQELMRCSSELEELRTHFSAVRDMDRLMSRVTSLRAVPRDLGALLESISVLPRIKSIVSGFSAPLLKDLALNIDELSDVQQRLSAALAEELPVRINEGGIFRSGCHEEIDRLRLIRRDGHLWLAELEEKERKRSGISGLKIRYNNIFGYFIEVTKAHLAKVPSDYERRQTLVNAERFVTRELKEYELTMLSAKAKLIELEKELFVELRSWVSNLAGRIQMTSRAMSILDVLASYAHLAQAHNYSRPMLDLDCETIIQGGRHPVVERVIGAHNFVPNDTCLNGAKRKFAVLTGPNMGGKSTYLRQVGLIQLMAQAGSFVPAKSAQLSLVDRIFTRIGAADDLSRGDSTFMVEMKEAASIVRKATSRSLVLIDEVGRGTATMDGLALAMAISEWLHDHIGCRTVFATHFHELTELSQAHDGAFCLAVGIIEKEKEIIFTHRIEEKAADRSYGIEVARLAGLPEALLMRAERIMSALEEAREIRETQSSTKAVSSVADAARQGEGSGLGVLRILRDRLGTCSPDFMTPLQALQEIVELKKIIDGTIEK